MGLDAEHGFVVSERDPPYESSPERRAPAIAIVGAGPAGLFAAERLAKQGFAVTIYERMPSPARKFLMAGRGGLNLTHSEDVAAFLTRYHDPGGTVARAVTDYPPSALIAWADGLGLETFVGSSGRVFPKAMKASPLLRAWLRRLADLGVRLQTGWTWRGFGDSPTHLMFDTSGGPQSVRDDAVLLAVGGASWPRLGSDGAWVSILQNAGLQTAGAKITQLQASNCGVLAPWSQHMAKHFGAPLKRVSASCGGVTKRGEALITKSGLEGGVIYALSQGIRDAFAQSPATAVLTLDLRPDMDKEALALRFEQAAKKDSMSNMLRKVASLSPGAIAVLRESGPLPRGALDLANRIKSVPIRITGLSGLERAISTAGGVTAVSLDDALMLKALPGVFVAGEMLDFDAPTGGYLLQAAFATGHMAACGLAAWTARESNAILR